MTIRVIRYRLFWYIVSLLLAGGALASFFLYGLRPSIDFTGGSLLDVTWNETRPTTESLQTAFKEQGIRDALIQPVEEKGTFFRFATATEEKHQEIIQALTKLGAMTENSFETIGPAIGKELQGKALWSVILVILAITLYVAWAFRHVSRPVASWKYGVITIIALLHDVLLPIGIFALLGKFLHIEVTSGFIVALLTVLGYSVNDTIIVFDRIRENLGRLGARLSFDEIIDTSVTQTFTRSINTTLTTLLSLVAIYFFGGESVKYFALALIIGITSGAYSSIFIASPLLATAYRLQLKKA
ncbi:MAG: protein translocase subunit SecF [bacterium]|nr:protein translocase subunit SecF [bacterium]